MDGLIQQMMGGDPQVPALQAVVRTFSFSPLHILLLTAIPGFAMLAAAFLPGRIGLAGEAAGRRPLPCWLAGLAVLAALIALLALLLGAGIRPGRWLLGTALLASTAAGVAVSARLVGGRLAAGATPFAQLMIGLGCLVLCLGSPAGLPVLALLAPLGLGGLLLARRHAVEPPSPS